jgi:hypothetical protein
VCVCGCVGHVGAAGGARRRVFLRFPICKELDDAAVGDNGAGHGA